MTQLSALFAFHHFPINFPFLVQDPHTVFPSWAFTVESLYVYTSCAAGQVGLGLALMTSFSLIPLESCCLQIQSHTEVLGWELGCQHVKLGGCGGQGDPTGFTGTHMSAVMVPIMQTLLLLPQKPAT